MSGESQGTRQLNWVVPPRAGLISTFAVSTSAGVVSLAALDNQTKSQGTTVGLYTGAQGSYVSFQADGCDVYVNVGPTNASVSSGNAPLPTATAGVNIAQGCFKIPSGSTLRMLCAAGTDLFVGYVAATGTGTLRVYKSGPA